MVWTNKHNELLVQEMYLFEPWNFKRGSKQRGQVWERISDSLNQCESPKFTVKQKSVRDHYIFLEKEQKKKIREEEQASWAQKSMKLITIMLINFLFSIITFIFHKNMHYFFESGDRLAQGEQDMGLGRFSGRDALARFFGHQLLNNNMSAMNY